VPIAKATITTIVRREVREVREEKGGGVGGGVTKRKVY
jgi:hypothetical protein